MKTNLDDMKKLTRTQLEAEIVRLQNQRELLLECLAGYMMAYQTRGGELPHDQDEWAYSNWEEEKDPAEAWAKAFKGEPRKLTEYVITRRDLEERLIKFEQVMTTDQEKLVEQLTAMSAELKSALTMRRDRELREESLWLLAKGLPEPYQTFFFDIVINGVPRWWGEGEGIIAKPPGFPNFSSFPGWAWVDGRAVSKPPRSAPVRPVSNNVAFASRQSLIQSLKDGLARTLHDLARLEWEQNLAQWQDKTEEEIEKLRVTVWYGITEQAWENYKKENPDG